MGQDNMTSPISINDLIKIIIDSEGTKHAVKSATINQNDDIFVRFREDGSIMAHKSTASVNDIVMISTNSRCQKFAYRCGTATSVSPSNNYAFEFYAVGIGGIVTTPTILIYISVSMYQSLIGLYFIRLNVAMTEVETIHKLVWIAGIIGDIERVYLGPHNAYAYKYTKLSGIPLLNGSSDVVVTWCELDGDDNVYLQLMAATAYVSPTTYYYYENLWFNLNDLVVEDKTLELLEYGGYTSETGNNWISNRIYPDGEYIQWYSRLNDFGFKVVPYWANQVVERWDFYKIRVSDGATLSVTSRYPYDMWPSPEMDGNLEITEYGTRIFHNWASHSYPPGSGYNYNAIMRYYFAVSDTSEQTGVYSGFSKLDKVGNGELTYMNNVDIHAYIVVYNIVGWEPEETESYSGSYYPFYAEYSAGTFMKNYPCIQYATFDNIARVAGVVPTLNPYYLSGAFFDYDHNTHVYHHINFTTDNKLFPTNYPTIENDSLYYNTAEPWNEFTFANCTITYNPTNYRPIYSTATIAMKPWAHVPPLYT